MSTWYSRNRHRYPPDWPTIAKRVKDAAGWMCEGCEAPHGPPPRVLTVDHLDHDPGNCADENLLALCQRCHLRRQGMRPRPLTREAALERLLRYHQEDGRQADLFPQGDRP